MCLEATASRCGNASRGSVQAASGASSSASAAPSAMASVEDACGDGDLAAYPSAAAARGRCPPIVHAGGAAIRRSKSTPCDGAEPKTLRATSA